MNSTQLKIRDLLGEGIPANMVASAVGVTPSYISQLLADPNFAMEVAELRTKDLVEDKETDDRYDRIEAALLEKLEDLIPFINKPRDVLDALMKINQAKRRNAIPAGTSQNVAGNVVTINLPSVIVNNFKINMAGGMVEVDGRSLQPLNSKELLKSLEDRRSQNGKGPLAEIPSGKKEPIVIDENSV